MSQLHERAEQLFAQALSLPLGERQGFLAQACAGDSVLLSRVEALLRGHSTAEFLESSVVTDIEDKLIGTRIGRYKLMEKIGEGGSGTVYLAEQEEPIRRRVALKIIKAGMDTREVISRFEAERQILAVMDHPNIARVYDCGATEAGRPFFVMELVQGTPITRYCDDRGLPIPERLELFIAVCRAIQHAHEKGIVHRDIKPTNVLVTLYDGIPSPKVIDFGVAKATEARLSGRTLFTSTAQFIGTPAYMSPEQADLGPVDARSDVYSLGVLLYELVTGFTPFDGTNLTSSGLDEMRRRMRQEDPPRPSQRLAAADPPTQAEMADRRGFKSADLIALLRRDLDGIVMRCIERDSARRYRTAIALAADVTAYLRHEPVAARTPHRRAPARTGRPRWALPAAGAGLLALIGAGLFLWKPWHRTEGGPAQATEASAEFPRDPDLKRAMKLINGTDAIPEDFSLAEDIIRAYLAQHPTDPDGVTAMALTEDAFLVRSFDITPARYASARRYSEQAVQLAPRNAAAYCALGIYLLEQPGGDLQRCRELLERATVLDPSNPMYRRFLDDELFGDRRVSTVDAITAAERAAVLFPNDALTHYDLGRHYRDVGRLDDFERELDRAIALEPITNAMIWKARLALWVRGDAEEMRAVLDHVPARGRTLERWSIGMWIYAMATGKSQAGLDALDALTETWSTDFDFLGPVAILKATLLEAQGQTELARLQYEAALSAVKTREAIDPADPENLCYEAWCMHGLGREKEAQAALGQYDQTLSRPYRTGFGRNWWFTAIPLNLLLGNRGLAMQLIREAAESNLRGRGSVVLDVGQNNVTRNGYATDFYRQLFVQNFRTDPRMAPWRNDPEILAILAPPHPLPEEAASLVSRTQGFFDKINYGRSDLALAEKFMARATDLAPDSAEVWALRGYVQAVYVLRTWDQGESRLRDGQNFSNQALALDPNQTEAMLSLAIVLDYRGADSQAEALLRRAVQLRPGDARLWRMLGIVVDNGGRREEGRKIMTEAVRRFPRDPLCWYDLSRVCRYGDTGAEELDALKHAVALAPMAGAYIRMTSLLAGAGDLTGAEATLAQLPMQSRTTDRAVAVAMNLGILERKPEKTIAAANLNTSDYFEDDYFLGPKAKLTALAYQIAGKQVLADQQWDDAAQVLRDRLQKNPQELDRMFLATVLAWRGKTVEAAALIEPIEAAQNEGAHPDWAFFLAQYYAGLGDAPKAVAYLVKQNQVKLEPSTMNGHWGPYGLENPWWDRIRDAPAFKALEAQTKAAAAANKPR